MHTDILYDNVEHLISELVLRPAVVTSTIAVFETPSQAASDKCAALLTNHHTHTTSLDGAFFLMVSLKPTSGN